MNDMTNTKISTKRLDLLKLHTGGRESVMADALDGGFRMVRGCVSLKEDEGIYLYYRGRLIDVDDDSRVCRYNLGSSFGCSTLTEAKAEVDRRIAEKAAA